MRRQLLSGRAVAGIVREGPRQPARNDVNDLFLLTPELLLSWRQPVTEAWYVEPGVGVGAVIGGVDFVGLDWGSGYSVRPFVRIGYQADTWLASVEASYRFGRLDLGESDVEIENLTAALFVTAKF